MEDIRRREEQLRSLATSLAPVAARAASSEFLQQFVPDVGALVASVENSLALYMLFEVRPAGVQAGRRPLPHACLLQKHHVTHPDQMGFGWFGLLPPELVVHLLSFLLPAELFSTRRCVAVPLALMRSLSGPMHRVCSK